MTRKRNPHPATRNNTPNLQKQNRPDVTIEEHQYSGPIPPPHILSGFDQIVPGAAERILTMAEENGSHQRYIEKETLKIAFVTRLIGQIFGLLIGLSAFFTCIVALYYGSEKTAMTIGGVTVVGLVAVFVTGRLRRTPNSNHNSVAR